MVNKESRNSGTLTLITHNFPIMHTITVEVRGGLVVDVTNIPPGTEVRVIDYDNDRTGQTADIWPQAAVPSCE
jgi:hypothetical protein